MYSLYHFLLAQHPKQLTPVRCRESTISQLHRYFEDVVLENNLPGMVIECLTLSQHRSAREIARLKDLDRTSQSCFLLLNPGDEFSRLFGGLSAADSKVLVLERGDEDQSNERFVVIADSRFSALLASVDDEEVNDAESDKSVIWTFEPDVVYSALEYLMARVSAEHPSHKNAFSLAVNASMPKATSLRLTLGVTTKLARLLQEQAEREVVMNYVAAAIGNSSPLAEILQTAANGVGSALDVQYCAVRIQGDLVEHQITRTYFRATNSARSGTVDLLPDLDDLGGRVSRTLETWVIDGDHSEPHPAPPVQTAQALIPLIYAGGFVGFLLVRTTDPGRVWADSELMFLHTVADQLTVGVKQAHLLAQLKQQALTDALTGCYNRRAFELQLERDLHLATRMRQPLSLIMLDIDEFKQINDRAGHSAGDAALRLLADGMRAELRAVDTAVRFGGDEFAIILPQANVDGGLIVAERLRRRIEQTEVPGYGRLTACLGLATFPLHASSRDTLIVAADRALYRAKHSGGNRVSDPPLETLESFASESSETDLSVTSLPRTPQPTQV